MLFSVISFQFLSSPLFKQGSHLSVHYFTPGGKHMVSTEFNRCLSNDYLNLWARDSYFSDNRAPWPKAQSQARYPTLDLTLLPISYGTLCNSGFLWLSFLICCWRESWHLMPGVGGRIKCADMSKMLTTGPGLRNAMSLLHKFYQFQTHPLFKICSEHVRIISRPPPCLSAFALQPWVFGPSCWTCCSVFTCPLWLVIQPLPITHLGCCRD